MLREAGLPARLALVGFILVLGLVARVAWVTLPDTGEEPGRVEVSQVAQKDQPAKAGKAAGKAGAKTGGKAPAASPSPVPSNKGALLNAGGPSAGPVPAMRDGECPEEFPIREGGGCYAAAP